MTRSKPGFGSKYYCIINIRYEKISVIYVNVKVYFEIFCEWRCLDNRGPVKGRLHILLWENS